MFKNIESIASNKIQFTITGMDLAYVNAVRRTILSEIPTVAFYFDPYMIEKNDIIVHENTTSLHNDFTMHRISLIPLGFDENEVENFDRSRYKFVLQVTNKTMKTISVTTEDFQIFEDDKLLTKTRQSKILPRNSITQDYILITKLKPNLYNTEKGATINLECVPTKSIGKVHSRWSPVSQCCFENVIDHEAAKEAFEALKKKNPNKTADELSATYNTLDIYRYFKKNEHDEPNEFIFKIESECNLRPTYLFFKGLLILKNKLNMFIKNLLSSEGDDVQIEKHDNMFQIKIKNEDHTLLNTLQCIIYNNEIRDQQKNLTYIGYYQPHPLDNVMLLKLRFKDSNIDINFVQNFVVEATNVIVKEVDNIIYEWVKFSKLDSTDIKEVQTGY